MFIAIIIFVGIPLLMGLIVSISYNLIFPLSKIDKLTNQYDEFTPHIPKKCLNIEAIRNHQQTGEKIVFTHHLSPLVKDFRKLIKRVIIKTLLIEFILLFVLSIGAALQNPNADIFDNINLLVKEFKLYYLTPLGMIAINIEFVFYYFFLNEQISKFLK
jgi:hypothetical protein